MGGASCPEIARNMNTPVPRRSAAWLGDAHNAVRLQPEREGTDTVFRRGRLSFLDDEHSAYAGSARVRLLFRTGQTERFRFFGAPPYIEF